MMSYYMNPPSLVHYIIYTCCGLSITVMQYDIILITHLINRVILVSVECEVEEEVRG